MEGLRISKYGSKIQNLKEQLAELTDLEQIRVLHEVIDDTPYKTQNYFKYLHDEYYIQHNKSSLLEDNPIKYELKVPKDAEPVTLYDLISNRHSLRDYDARPMPFQTFSEILHYSFGVKNVGRGAYNKRSFPFKYSNTQGGLNYLDIYYVVNNVTGIEQGLYYHDFLTDSICLLDFGNMRGKLAEINFQNEFTVYSNFVCFIVADLSRVVPKYYKRAYRFAHVDAGVLLAYMQLIAEQNGVGSCAVAGYLEHVVEDLLQLSSDEYPLLSMSFGYKRGAKD